MAAPKSPHKSKPAKSRRDKVVIQVGEESKLGEEPKKKSQKKKKDPNAPKKPLTAFMLFTNFRRIPL
jgi:hypothetical protein